MSYCHACGGFKKVEYTFGGEYDGSGNKLQLSNWRRSDKLKSNASVDSERVPHKMYQHVASRGTCVAVPATPKPTPSPTSKPPPPAPSPSNPSTYHAADGCLKTGEKQTDVCLASEHTSNVPVNCCSGSMENKNLQCSRGNGETRSTFAEAKNVCEKKGMRLCSVAELETGKCCGKGFGYDWKISWTSDTCETELTDGTTIDGDGNTVAPTNSTTYSPTSYSPTSYSPTSLSTSSPTNSPEGKKKKGGKKEEKLTEKTEKQKQKRKEKNRGD